ncbi:OmpA family protein [Agrobacterium pusense]|uniref:OmpA family protein n=2 Tax=Hyphomicrobiales TaxID=356 RepID=UPI001C6E30E4|nr:OmpA family protein [Agrobacterium pusense]MBW9069809.1 OmpA family protein [Agrobacterium pusense]MBW9084952.1 OmpA family protein [Agrobacterium pusense]MBW9125573.1 OmpA family protein [Agrobacterium pusense]MBW9137988.1 OmpA family protein [Agrobacterium pusense]
MKLAIILTLLLMGPAAASQYSVTVTSTPSNEQLSRFREVDFAASTFSERAEQSGASFSSETSSFGLKDMDDTTRMKTEDTLVKLGAKQVNGRILVSLPSDVLFDFDKSNIRPDAEATLSQLSEVLITMHDSRVEITGHTDSKGSDEYNDKLSIRRANSVKAWLEENGVISKMTTAGKGERSPVAPNQTASGADDPNGRQKNRRVEFVIGGN